MTDDFFSGPPDPHDVRAILLDLSENPSGDEWIARLWIEDGTDAEGVEVVCCVSDSVRWSAGLEAESIERGVARYINLISPREHRLAIVRARTELRGEYRLRGDSEVGLFVTEVPIPVPS